MSKPTVRFLAKGSRYQVSFQYNANLVEHIKTIPSYARSFDPATKTWLVDRQFAETFAEELRRSGYTVAGMDPQPNGQARPGGRPPLPPPPPPKAIEANWAETLLDRAGPELAEKLHKALVRVLHPDVGGDPKLMQELNAARSRKR